MKPDEKQNIDSETKVSDIYLSIDHLKKGAYKLRVTLKNKIVKTIKLKKK